MTKPSRVAVAQFHEAAHAVAAYRFSLPVRYVRVYNEADRFFHQNHMVWNESATGIARAYLNNLGLCDFGFYAAYLAAVRIPAAVELRYLGLSEREIEFCGSCDKDAEAVALVPYTPSEAAEVKAIASRMVEDTYARSSFLGTVEAVAAAFKLNSQLSEHEISEIAGRYCDPSFRLPVVEPLHEHICGGAYYESLRREREGVNGTPFDDWIAAEKGLRCALTTLHLAPSLAG